MRTGLFLLITSLFVINTQAQSPGGIPANNTMWLRSDIGLNSAGNIVSQWQELSGAGITGNFNVQSLLGTANVQTGPTVVPAGINFNPYIHFDGVTNSLSSTNIFPGTSLVANSNVTVFQVLTIRGGIVWLKWETDQVGSTARFGFENAGGRLRFDFPKAVPASAGQNIGVTTVLNKHTLSTCYADATASVNRLSGANDNTLPIPGPGNFAAKTDKIVIGNENLLNLPAQVDIAEIIIYSRTLSALERNKIESYLAVKYGFTLDQAAANANDYTSSNGTIIWNRASNSGYAANITGIGRDDASALSQKQSKSVNSAGLITLYNGIFASGSFPLLNSDNTNSFSNDMAYLLIGDNAGSTAVDQCIFNGKAKRMSRVWKVSETGPLFPVTVAADQAAIPATVKNIIVSPDPAFPPGNTVIYPLNSAPGKWYRDIIFNQNDYFTYATDSLVVAMVPTDPTCTNANGGSVNTTVSGNSETPVYSWTPSGQATPNLSGVAAGNYTLTITQGTCQSAYPVTLNAPAAIVAPLANGVSVCSGNTATLTVQNPQAGFVYNWYDATTGGTALGTGTSFTTPAITTAITYYVEAVNGICTSVRTPVNVSITVVTDPVVAPVLICTGTAAILTIQNPLAGYTYNWYDAATGGTTLGTGTSFTTPALTASTTYYAEAVISTCPGTRVPVAVSIDVVNAPVSSDVAVCTGNSAILTVQNPLPGNTYDWYTTSVGGAPSGTGVTYNTPAVNIPVTFYVEASDGLCKSTRTPVNISLLPQMDTAKVTATTVTTNSITFSWQPVTGAAGYEVSVDGGPYFSPGSGPGILNYTVNGLSTTQTVTISVVALSPPQGCGNSQPGHATATTYGTGFYVPSAFTPNGDSRNDVLTPVLPGGSVLDYFTVYNRWGQKVFTTATIGAGWDGRLKGKLQPLGTFVWVCRYNYRGTVFIEKGSFTLLY